MKARAETCYANDRSDPRNAVNETEDDKKEAIKKHAENLFKNWIAVECALDKLTFSLKPRQLIQIGAAIEIEDCAILGELLMQPLRDFIFEEAREEHEQAVLCRYACQSDRFEEE